MSTHWTIKLGSKQNHIGTGIIYSIEIKEVANQFSNSIVLRETAVYTNIDWSNSHFFSFFQFIVGQIQIIRDENASNIKFFS